MEDKDLNQMLALIPHQISDIQKMVSDVRADIKDIKANYVLREVYVSELNALKKRVNDLEAQRNWIVVAVFSGIIAQIFQLLYR